MTLELFCERVQLSHLVEKKMCIPCTFAISHADYEEIEILGLEFGFLFGCFCPPPPPEKYFQGDLAL